MAYSSVDVVGRDIYGFLDFLSRRQGPNDSTNPQPPPPGPQVASADAGAVAPGASMPGSQIDVPPGPLPFQPPKPVSSKPVQVAAAGGVGGQGPATPPVPPRAVPVPVPKVEEPPKVEAPTAITSDKGTKPGTGVSPGTPVFGGGNTPVPLFDPNTGKIDVLGILKAQQDAANKRAALEGIVRGGTMIAGSMTKSPSMRAALFGAAGGGGSGSGSGGGAGDISAASLLEMDKQSRATAAAAYKSKIAPIIGERLGIPPELVQFMDDDKIATITTAFAKGENLKREERADGSVYYLRPDGKTAFSLSPDELKVQKAGDEHAKTGAEIGKIDAETGKIKTDTLETQRRIVRDQNLEKSIPQIAQRYDLSEDQIRQLYASNKLDEFMAERDKETPEYKKWRELKTEEIRDGKKPTSYSDFMWTTAFGGSPTGGPGGKAFTEVTLPSLKEHGKAVDAGRGTLPFLTQRMDALKRGDLAVGPLAGSEWFQNSMTWMKTMYPDLDISGVTNAQAFNAAQQAQIGASLKRYGFNPTDKDAQLAIKELGDPTKSEEALYKISRMIIRSNVQQTVEFNQKIDKLQQMPGLNRDPALRDVLEVERREIGDYTEQMWGSQERKWFDEAFAKKPDGTYLLDEKQIKQQMDKWDRTYGPGMAKYYLQMHPELTD